MKEIKEVWATAQYIDENGVLTVFPRYKVSNLGRVMSFCKKEPKELPQWVKHQSNGDYSYVTLWVGKNRGLRVNRLVMSSFQPEDYFEGAVADHKDPVERGKCDNRLINLRWLSQKDNSGTAHRRKASSDTHMNHPSLSKRVKVTWPDGSTTIFPSSREAGRSMGIHPNNVAQCIRKQHGYFKKLNVFFEYV